jgi:hypothetical protein
VSGVERLEYGSDQVLRYAGTAVVHSGGQGDLSVSLTAGDMDGHFPGLGEFERIANQIVEQLFEPHFIAGNPVAADRVPGDREDQVLLGEPSTLDSYNPTFTPPVYVGVYQKP